MRILGAYLLAVLGGKEEPGADDVTKILDSVGIKADKDELKLVLSQLKGKNIDELIKEGSKRISVVHAAPAHGGASHGAAPGKTEEKKEAEKPKKEEKPKEESGADMGFSLFD